MLLAEAIKEKDYLKSLIVTLRDHICELVLVSGLCDESNTDNITQRQNELEDLYKKYRQFSVTIERAKAKVTIKVNDTDLLLSDAMVVLDTMRFKNENIGIILTRAYEKIKSSNNVCVNIDQLFESMKNNLLDMKTIESEIDYALWNVEVE